MAVGNVSTTSAILDSLSIDRKNGETETTGNSKLDKDAFLKLMIAQLKNQNPLEPQSNADFVAQLAQFSSVEGLQELNSTVGQMASSSQSSQALQASSLVGRTVKVESTTAQLGASGKIEGTAYAPVSLPGITISVTNSAGELVYKKEMGPQAAGDVKFEWDGKNANGETMPAGTYKFTASSTYQGEAVQLHTYMSANVNSVTLGANNTVTLNVAGVGPISVNAVKEIL